MVGTSPDTVAALVSAELTRQERTVAWLSRKTGIAQTTLARKLKGHTDFGSTEMVIVARALGIHPSVITPAIFKDPAA